MERTRKNLVINVEGIGAGTFREILGLGGPCMMPWVSEGRRLLHRSQDPRILQVVRKTQMDLIWWRTKQVSRLIYSHSSFLLHLLLLE